jgi:hypothetical protein
MAATPVINRAGLAAVDFLAAPAVSPVAAFLAVGAVARRALQAERAVAHRQLRAEHRRADKSRPAVQPRRLPAVRRRAVSPAAVVAVLVAV